MADPITKTQRWLDLISFLVGRRLPVTVDEIMERVPAYARQRSAGDATHRASVRRMFERDKDELRRAGIPIETVSYAVNYGHEMVEGYRIARKDFYLPYLRLLGARGVPGERPYAAGVIGEIEIQPEDAAIALDALRYVGDLPGFPLGREARSAYRKLSFDLAPTTIRESPFVFADPVAKRETEALRALAEALLARKRVRFRYHGIRRGTPTDREVALYGLMYQGGCWYAIGHDATRDALRVFRVGRIEEIQVNPRAPRTPDYSIPPDFRLADYTGRKAWELAGGEDTEPLRVRVLFPFPTSLWADRNQFGELVEERAGGAAVRDFEVHQLDAFLRWLLGTGAAVEVIQPAEARLEFRRVAHEVLALYGPEAEGARG